MEENATIDMMKSSIDAMIYSSVSIEGIGATFAQTQEIIEKGRTAGVSTEDIDKVLNIKHAWEYLFDHFGEVPSWELYRNYNRIIGAGNVKDPGEVRAPNSVMVGTGRLDAYIPPKVTGEDDFNRILETAKATYHDCDDIACAAFLMLAKAQFFNDGNKRTAQLLVNHYLAHEDAGYIFCLLEGDRDKMLETLVEFYMGDLSLDDAEFDLYDMSIIRATPQEMCEPKEQEEPAKTWCRGLSR